MRRWLSMILIGGGILGVANVEAKTCTVRRTYDVVSSGCAERVTKSVVEEMTFEDEEDCEAWTRRQHCKKRYEVQCRDRTGTYTISHAPVKVEYWYHSPRRTVYNYSPRPWYDPRPDVCE